MKIHFRLPAALLLSMFLFGCGQSGPLYVSGNPSSVSVEVPTSQVDSEEEDDQDGETAAAE